MACVLTLIATSGLLLRRFPPQAYFFYPICPIHQWTGLLCPGCGATRAVAALTRGSLAEALHCNALAVGALGSALAYALLAYARALYGRRPVLLIPSTRLITSALAIAAAFTLWRNLI